MTLELRELNGGDLEHLLTIFAKLDIIDELTDIFERPENLSREEADVEKTGISIFAKLAKKAIANIKPIKKELDELLADLSGLTVEEINDVRLLDYLNGVKAIFEDGQITDFFGSMLSQNITQTGITNLKIYFSEDIAIHKPYL